MLAKTVTVTGAGVSAPVVFDILENPFNVGIGCVVSNGPADYTVQHTFDDIITLGAAGCVWFDHDDPVFVHATANANSNYDYPVRGSQVVNNSGATIAATFIQAGVRR